MTLICCDVFFQSTIIYAEVDCLHSAQYGLRLLTPYAAAALMIVAYGPCGKRFDDCS
jgi:hypothetical protein